jgi:hypothetical protein
VLIGAAVNLPEDPAARKGTLDAGTLDGIGSIGEVGLVGSVGLFREWRGLWSVCCCWGHDHAQHFRLLARSPRF